MKKIALLLSLVFIVVAPLLSFAHPGHGGTDGYTIIHYFVEPMHAFVTLGIFAFTIVLVKLARSKKESNQE